MSEDERFVRVTPRDGSGGRDWETVGLRGAVEDLTAASRIVTVDAGAAVSALVRAGLGEHLIELETHACPPGVEQADLVENALRMRPDAVIIGAEL